MTSMMILVMTSIRTLTMIRIKTSDTCGVSLSLPLFFYLNLRLSLAQSILLVLSEVFYPTNIK